MSIGSDHDWISGIAGAMNCDAVAVVVARRVDLHVPRVDDVRNVRDPGREDGKAKCEG